MSIAKVLTAQPGAVKAQLVNVETDVSVGLYGFIVVGLPSREVDESKDRVVAALKNSGIPSPKSENRKIVTALSPAHINKVGTHFDLPIAISYLKSTGQVKLQEEYEDAVFVGELNLSGEVCPVSGVLSIAMLANSLGIKNIFVPEENKLEAALVPGLNIFPVKNLRQLIDFFDPESEGFESIQRQEYLESVDSDRNAVTDDPFSQVVGQILAKRALLIAAAGGHNVALYGPPGTGKTMLAKSFSKLLPPLSREAMLEATSIHSYAGVLNSALITTPPFRSPHHSASNVSLVGGGNKLRPGEITLAHRGVLFLDEFPEFDKKVVESLRQPLEDGEVTVSRARGTVKYPARFTLVCALNPCPCGFLGAANKNCICKESDILRYERKISGPIVDRIDLWVEVPHVSYEDFGKVETKSDDSKRKVQQAREQQKKRYGKDSLNAYMSQVEMDKHIVLGPDVEEMLVNLSKKFSLSPRSFNRMKKIARTIADIENSEKISVDHILEAFQYRPKIRE